MLGEEGPGVLDDVHGQHQLVVVVSQLAHFFYGHAGGPGAHDLVGEVDLQVLRNGGHQETGQREGRLAQNVADERLRNVAADGQAKGGLCGHVQGRVLPTGSGWGGGV